MITDSALLKSCAMPPASVAIASSRCMRSTRSASSSCCVNTSTVRPTWIRSPTVTVVGLLIRTPLSSVPFELWRSSSWNAPLPVQISRA